MARIIKIAIISKSDGSGGGASRVAEDLANYLSARSDEFIVHHWSGVSAVKSILKSNHRCLHGKNILSKYFFRVCRFFSRVVGLPDFFTPELMYFLLSKKMTYDLYHFHDISSAFSPIAFRWLARKVPVIWTFHDLSPITGGCIQPIDCTKYLDHCCECPQLRTWPMLTRFDFTHFIQFYKRRTAEITQFQPVVPSRWLYNQVMRVHYPSKKPVIINNCVDLQVFYPQKNIQLRESLGFTQTEFIVLLCGVDLDSSPKGIEFSIKTLKSSSIKPSVLCIGNGGVAIAAMLDGFKVRCTGFVADRNTLAEYYNVADVLLFTSLAETWGNIISETMACGVPTLGFSSGAISEVVSHDLEGWLVSPRDVDGLVSGLDRVMHQPETLMRWSRAGICKAQESFSAKKFVESHIRLYHDVLDTDKS